MSGEFRRTQALDGRALPAKLVTALLAAPRGLVAVARWIRRDRPAGQLFPHHGDVAIILWAVVVSVVVEGVVVDLVLRMILGSSPWVWIALGLHVSVVFMLVAVYAGMVTRPHSLDGAVLRLRAGLGTEVAVAVTGIEKVQAGRYAAFDQSPWKVDEDGNATMAPREANLRLTLAVAAEVMVDGRAQTAPRTIHVTVDEPRLLAAAVADARAVPSAEACTVEPANAAQCARRYRRTG